MFLLFACYGIWCVVLHGMLVPGSEVGGGTLLLRFFLVCDEDDAELLNRRRMCLVGRGDKYLTTTKIKHSGF
jgi:hypothetical protein